MVYERCQKFQLYDAIIKAILMAFYPFLIAFCPCFSHDQLFDELLAHYRFLLPNLSFESKIINGVDQMWLNFYPCLTY